MRGCMHCLQGADDENSSDGSLGGRRARTYLVLGARLWVLAGVKGFETALVCCMLQVQAVQRLCALVAGHESGGGDVDRQTCHGKPVMVVDHPRRRSTTGQAKAKVCHASPSVGGTRIQAGSRHAVASRRQGGRTRRGRGDG